MKPRLDLLDFIVAIGMFATGVGGLFLVVASYGAWGLPPPPKADNPITAMSVMQSIQTGMGEEIVEVAKLDYAFKKSIDRVSASLTHSSRTFEIFSQKAPIAEVVRSRFDRAKAEHDSQLQYLMGKSIVALTGQGFRAGALTVNTLDGPVNDRIIKTAQRYGALGQNRFHGQNQGLLGKWISEESQSRQRLNALLQERMGEVIVQKASMERAYGAAKSDGQTQLHALTAAAIRSETPEARLAQLSQSQDFQRSLATVTPAAGVQVSFSGLWNDTFIAYAIVLLLLLPAILIWSLTFPRVSFEKTVNMERILELTMEMQMYRTPVKSS
jgi:hypothetical protein